MLTVEGEANAFFAEKRKSVRNSDVDGDPALQAKFWRLLGGEEREVDHVRRVSIVQLPRSSVATHSRIPRQSRTCAEDVARNIKWPSLKAVSARAREQKKEQRGALAQVKGFSLCEVGWHRRADIACLLEAEMLLSMVCARGEPGSLERIQDAALDV